MNFRLSSLISRLEDYLELLPTQCTGIGELKPNLLIIISQFIRLSEVAWIDAKLLFELLPEIFQIIKANLVGDFRNAVICQLQ